MINLRFIYFLFNIFVLICHIDAKPTEKLRSRELFKSASSCGYDSCHPTKDGVINVHLVPHTHDDVGWLKTVDQYYFGHRNNIQKAGVQYILDSVIDELIKDPKRRFVYVESAFFEKWWSFQNDQRRHHVKRLVSEGRLEFAGGAWSMNDEAAAHYHSIIDQLTWGLRFLNDTFGECGSPKAGWQIDPFGHSREFANILAMSGFDGLLLGRVDYQDRKHRSSNKELEMIWRGSDDLGTASDILTGIMYNTYSPPPGFCFDVLCSDEPVIDDINSPDYNVKKLVEKFTAYVVNMTKVYKTNNVIVTMGGDFTYQDALMWYKNLDKLIGYVNGMEKKLNLLYSTPSCYIKSLFDSNATWPVKQDDFFPYSSDEHAYWTGYFTSRPTSKYFERKGNNFLQVCKQLYAMTNLNERDKVDLNMLRTAMGIMQHHDAITGTEKQHVANDYARILENGIQDCLIVAEEALNKLIKVNDDSIYLPMTLCNLNMSQCAITETSTRFIATVYNPLAHTVSEFIRLPVTGDAYKVTDAIGEANAEILSISENVLKQLQTRVSKSTKELIIYAENVPALGFMSYFIEKVETKQNKFDKSNKNKNSSPISPSLVEQSYKSKKDSTDMTIGNDYIQIRIDPATGYVGSLSYIDNKNRSITIPLKQEILYYEGMIGNNTNSKLRASGAYIFRPNSKSAKTITNKPENTIVKGDLVEEIHQKFSNWASQTIRIYRTKGRVEFEWLIGPIPVEDKIGKEIISRFSTNFKTDSTFYTDSNGRQMLKRILNRRPTWNLEMFEPVSGNYYPVTSMIGIKDIESKKSIHVLTDRSQGGSSLEDGQIELMIHRRLLHDDAFGVEEALNETENGIGLIARGTHYLIVGDDIEDASATVQSRILGLKKLLEPTVFISSADNATLNRWKNNNNNMFKGIADSLPPNIHLLTLEPWKGRSILIRLEHFFQANDDPSKLSDPVTIDLDKLFTKLKITSVKETTLAANHWKEDRTNPKWNIERKMEDNFNDAYNNGKSSIQNDAPSVVMMNHNNMKNRIHRRDNNYFVTLNPMEIKTFVIEVEFNEDYMYMLI